MKRSWKRCAVCVASLVMTTACGGSGNGNGDPDDLVNPGFIRPGSSDADWDQPVTEAYSEEQEGVYVDEGPADWSCLNTPSNDEAPDEDVTFTGLLEDFQTSKALPGAEIHVFTDVADISGDGVASTMADEDGNWTVTFPAGHARAAFRVVAEGQLDTYTLNEPVVAGLASQDKEIDSVSLLTANALPAFIGITRTPGLGVLAGDIADCNGNHVAGAIVTVSSVSGSPEHLDGALSYYFSAEPNNSLPVRHNLAANTNKDGRFTVLELDPTASAYLQLWGFTDGQSPDSDDLTLLAEIPSPILPDSVVISKMEPLRQ